MEFNVFFRTSQQIVFSVWLVIFSLHGVKKF